MLELHMLPTSHVMCCNSSMPHAALHPAPGQWVMMGRCLAGTTWIMSRRAAATVLSAEKSRVWLPRAVCKGLHAAHTSYMFTAAPHLLLLEVQDLAGAGCAQVLHVNGICTDGQVCVCARVVSCLL